MTCSCIHTAIISRTTTGCDRKTCRSRFPVCSQTHTHWQQGPDSRRCSSTRSSTLTVRSMQEVKLTPIITAQAVGATRKRTKTLRRRSNNGTPSKRAKSTHAPATAPYDWALQSSMQAMVRGLPRFACSAPARLRHTHTMLASPVQSAGHGNSPYAGWPLQCRARAAAVTSGVCWWAPSLREIVENTGCVRVSMIPSGDVRVGFW